MHVAICFLLLVCSPDTDALSLYTRWKKSPSPELRIQAARALRGIAGSTARAALYTLLDDDHVGVRAAVRGELERRPADETAAMGAEVLALKKVRARREGLRVLLARKADPTVFLRDADPAVRARALASGRIARRDVTDELLRSDPITRALAIELRAEPALGAAFFRDRHEPVRIAAARVLTDPAKLRSLLLDRSWRVRLAAVNRCRSLRARECVVALIESLPRAEGRLQVATLRALVDLTRVDFGLDVGRWRQWWEARGSGFEVSPRRAVKKKRSHTSSALTFRNLPVASHRICFVLDGSRSMEKPAPGRRTKDGVAVPSRWDLVIRDLEAVLDRLPRAAKFNVMVFQTDVRAWKKKLVRATPGARRACKAWIQTIRPAGWTNLYDALDQALRDDDVDSLFVLTDGVPSRGAETTRTAILQEIRLLNRYRLVQINCVQAGGAEGLGKRWRGFLDELARENQGRSVRD